MVVGVRNDEKLFPFVTKSVFFQSSSPKKRRKKLATKITSKVSVEHKERGKNRESPHSVLNSYSLRKRTN